MPAMDNTTDIPTDVGMDADGGAAAIRRATAADIPELDRLLRQVLEVHHAGRPDLFKTGEGVKKYTDGQLAAILASDETPVFVMTADQRGAGGAPQRVRGYAFCQFQRHPHDAILTDITTLYVDDICVDEAERGHGVGTALYRHALAFARESGCHNLTLNVWSCNPGAQAFYERMGLVPYKVGMEQRL